MLNKMKAISAVLLLSVLGTGSALAVPPDVSAFTAIGADMTATATILFGAFAGVAAGIWILYYVFTMGRKMAGKAT